MSAGIPIISSLEGENAELLKKTNTGLLYEAGNSNELLKRIETLVYNEDLRLYLSKNAQNLFDNKFSHKAIFGELCKFLINLQRSYGK